MTERARPGSVLMELPATEADHTTTLAQLGGRAGLRALQARDIVYTDRGGYVMMRVGPGSQHFKLIVMLRPSDTYGVEIGRLKRHEGLPEFFSLHVLEDGIYGDQLAEAVRDLHDRAVNGTEPAAEHPDRRHPQPAALTSPGPAGDTSMSERTARLGSNQRTVLEELQGPRWGGRWFAGCGWIMGTVSRTEAILQSLQKRGLVTSVRVPYPPVVSSGTYRVWTITEQGRRFEAPDPQAGA